MALPFRIPSLEDVDEALRENYKADGKEYVLDLDGAPDPDKEIKDQNRVLNTKVRDLGAEVKALHEKYGGLDPEFIKKAADLEKAFKEEEEKKLIKEGRWEDLVARRNAAFQREHKKQVEQLSKQMEELKGTNQSLRTRVGSLTIDTTVTKALEAKKVKPRDGALADILARARRSWAIDDEGAMVPVDGDGGTRYGEDAKPLTMEEFVEKDLLADAAHLFEGSQGGGGKGSGGRPGSPSKTISVEQPWAAGDIEKIAKGDLTVLEE